jgi:hypothetical protein
MEPEVAFPENWKSPPELARALPRDVRLTGRGIFSAVIAVVLLVGAVPLFLFLRGQDQQRVERTRLLRTEGQAAEGEIVRLWHEGKYATPMVRYAFTAGGLRIQGQSSVPKDRWDRIRIAGFLPVRYLPSNPKINHPAAWDEPSDPAWLALLCPLILAGCGLGVLWNLRRQAGVVAEGQPAPGSVTACYRIRGGWVIRYRFRTKEGAVAKGSSRGRRQEIGATVCVLYLRDNPGRSLMYPGCLYRVDA